MRRLLSPLLLAWTLVPWVFLAWLGSVIAYRRWSGLSLDASLLFGMAAAVQGWRLVCRWSERQHDLAGARLLEAVPEPEVWEQFVHPVQTIKVAHLSHCQRRWGVNTRSSGWTLMARASCLDLAAVPVCMVPVVHAWWLGV